MKRSGDVSPRIVLVRHGPSAHLASAGVIDRAGLQRWREEYDTAGIQTVTQPPEALVQVAAEAVHIVASDLRRAIGSAERLAPNRHIRVSGLLAESPLPIPRWPTPLPFGAWEALIHLGWNYRIVRGIDATEADRARAAAAAEWLAGIVADGSTALVVTHGVFRRLVAKALVERRWTSAGRRGGYHHWSSWSYAGPAETWGKRPVATSPR
jgi:broad specificity phosphatase PhoE